MLNLIKSDLFRFFKSKQLIIIAIIAGVFSFTVPALNFILAITASKLATDTVIISELRASASALNRMNDSLNPSSLFGFLLPIFVSIILAADFKDGTIRNKIVTGISKAKIHASNYIATFVFITVVMLTYGIFTFLFGLIFFNAVPGNSDVGLYVGNTFLSILFDILAYIFVASMILFLVNVFRTQGISAFMYIVALFAFQFLAGIFLGITTVIEVYETNMDALLNFLYALNWINPFYLMTKISVSGYSTSIIVSCSITFIVWAVVNYFLSYLIFVKKDIK